MNHPVKAQLLVCISGLPHFHFRRGNQNKTEGPSFLSCKYHVFFPPFKEKKLSIKQCAFLQHCSWGQPAAYEWGYFSEQLCHFSERPDQPARIPTLWQDHGEKRESHYSDALGDGAARVRNLKVLCSGSRKNKVGHFYLCNKDISFDWRVFFLQDVPFSPALPFWNVSWLRLLPHRPELERIATHLRIVCVYPSSEFISIGQLPHNRPPIKMFWANLPFMKWSIQAFWSFLDQRPVQDNSLFMAGCHF